MAPTSPTLTTPSLGPATTDTTGFGLLSRLNFFDGLFLRASHLSTEQTYYRTLAHLVARAGGPGIVDGFELSRASSDLRISAGLAFDGRGRPLFTTEPITLTPSDLARAYETRPGGVDLGGGFEPCEDATGGPSVGATIVDGIYLVCLGPSEKLCGFEEVMGALCENACVKDSDRPYRVEGARAWLTRVTLDPATSSAIELGPDHLRSRVASAFFVRERGEPSALISGAGLRSDLWCRGSGFEADDCVPLGLLSIRGGALHFVDAWSARRERMQMPPQRYWSHRLRMRPLDLFLAEVFQFQCQLSEVLGARGEDGTFEPTDPCLDERQAIEEVARWFEKAKKGIRKLLDAGGAEVKEALGDYTSFDAIGRRLAGLEGKRTITGRRILIEQGIVELPPAGYLPIDVESAQTVNEQVRRWMGEGVDLRFCRARPDYVAHAFEEAQHLDRISLLRGLDDPTDLQDVDVIVPDGIVEARNDGASGATYEVRASLSRGFQERFSEAESVEMLRKQARSLFSSRGGGRSEVVGGTWRFAFAGTTEFQDKDPAEPGAVAVPVEEKPKKKMVFSRTKMPLDELEGAEVRTAYTAKSMTDARAKHPDRPKGRAERYESVKKVLEIANRELSQRGVERPGGAVWADIQSSTDPSAVASGDVARATGRVTILQPGDKWRLLDLDGSAEMVLASVSRTNSTLIFDGTLRMLGEGRQISAGEDVSVPFSHELSVTGSIDRARKRLEVNATYAVGVGEIVLRLLGARVGDQTTLRLMATLKGARNFRTAFSLDLHVDGQARALDPGQPLRALAAQAIDVLEQGLADASFGQAARAFLFGRTPEAQTELVLRPKHDWVMFHRRRVKDCGQREVVPPAPRPDRTYAVFHIDERRARELIAGRDIDLPEGEDVRAALSKLIAEDAFPPEAFAKYADRIAVAAYAAATPDLTTDPAALAVDFAAAGPSDEISMTMIGSPGDTDGESLELHRSEELTYALQAVSVPATDLAALWTDTVPLALTRPDADGYALVVTRPTAKKSCHEVYVSGLPQQNLPYGDASFLAKHLRSDAVARVTEAELVEGTAELVSDPAELAETYKAANPGGEPVAVVRVLTRSGDTDPEPAARAVLDAMVGGGDNWELDVRVVGPRLPSECDVVLLVEVKRPLPQAEACQEVYWVVSPNLTLDAASEPRVLRQVLLDPATTIRLAEARFDPGTSDLRSDPNEIRAALARNRFAVDAAPQAFALARSDADMAAARAKAVLEAVGAQRIALTAASVGPELPSSCDSVLLLLMKPQG